MMQPIALCMIDYEHVRDIYIEIKLWSKGLLLPDEKDRILPNYLLVAYTKNILEYWEIITSGAVVYESKSLTWETTSEKIKDCLSTIESSVMSRDFEDLECRAEIIRLYHEAGYQTAGQTRLKL